MNQFIGKPDSEWVPELMRLWVASSEITHRITLALNKQAAASAAQTQGKPAMAKKSKGRGGKRGC